MDRKYSKYIYYMWKALIQKLRLKKNSKIMKLYFRQENEPPHLQILTYFLVLHQDYKQLDSIVGWGGVLHIRRICYADAGHCS